jgi:hypothetical protein
MNNRRSAEFSAKELARVTEQREILKKSGHTLANTTEAVCPNKTMSAEHSITFLCQTLGV